MMSLTNQFSSLHCLTSATVAFVNTLAAFFMSFSALREMTTMSVKEIELLLMSN